MQRRIVRLTADQLRIDPLVQREAPPRHVVVNVVKNWNRDATGVLVVSYRDDNAYYLLDGQTRCLAALECDPHYAFQVEVHEGLTRADEIDLFELHNQHRRAVAAVELLQLKINRGREPYATLGIELARRNLKLRRSGGASSLNVITSAVALETLVAHPRYRQLLPTTLDAVLEAFPREEFRWRSTFLAGVVWAVVHADNARVPLNPKRFARSLTRHLPKHWEDRARARAQVSPSHASTLAGRAIVEEYNKRLSLKHRVPTPWNEQTREGRLKAE